MPSHEFVFTFKVFREGNKVDFVSRQMNECHLCEIREGCCVALKCLNSASLKIGLWHYSLLSRATEI